MPGNTIGHVALVGMGRSGTTAVEALLTRELCGVAVGELPGVWTAFSEPGRRCSCGEPSSSCPFWSTVGSTYPSITDSRTVEFMRQMNRRLLPIRHSWRWPFVVRRARIPGMREHRYAVEVEGLYAGLRDASARLELDVVVDSAKHPLWYAMACSSRALGVFDRSVPIQLVRHPHAVARSLKHPHTSPAARQNKYNLVQSMGYCTAMNLGAEWAAPDAVLVRYEDLGDVHQLRAVLRAQGLGPPADTSSTNGGQAHQLVGNPSRGSARERGFVPDNRWREPPMSRRELVAWRALRPVLTRYGYESKPPD